MKKNILTFIGVIFLTSNGFAQWYGNSSSAFTPANEIMIDSDSYTGTSWVQFGRDAGGAKIKYNAQYKQFTIGDDKTKNIILGSYFVDYDLLSKQVSIDGNLSLDDLYVKNKLNLVGSSGQNANGTYVNLAEFKHINNSQGIGFTHNTIYALGRNSSQHIFFKSRGSGNIILDPQQGEVEIVGNSRIDGRLKVYSTSSEASGGIEFVHSNETQGIGFGYNTIYATGTNASQKLGLKSRGSGNIILDPQQGKVKIGNKLDINDTDFHSHIKDVTFNTTATTDTLKLSLNTDRKVEYATATVAGAVYIGSISEKTGTDATPEKFKDEYLKDYNLWVEDGIVTEDIAIVSVNKWSDEVFEEDYVLMPLEEIEEYIKNNKHLPGIKPEAEIKKEGYSIQEMDVILLEKVEELTLYTIQQEKKIKDLEKKLNKYKNLESEIFELKELISSSQK